MINTFTNKLKSPSPQGPAQVPSFVAVAPVLQAEDNQVSLCFEPFPSLEDSSAFRGSPDLLWELVFGGKSTDLLQKWPQKLERLKGLTRS